MGRPAKTLAAHKADGTYREDRHGSLDVPCELPDPIANLSPEARSIYDEIGGQLVDLGVVSSLDVLALQEAACCAADLEACRELLRQSSHQTPDGKENPLCGTINRLSGTLYRYLCQLGLTPRSRTGLTPTPKSEIDPLDMV